MSSAEDELLVPRNVRSHVIDRDGHVCRLCGVWAEMVHVHHIIYRSQGGKDRPENLVSLDWRCHSRVHGNKPLWLPVLQQVVLSNGVNGIQLLRWHHARG